MSKPTNVFPSLPCEARLPDGKECRQQPDEHLHLSACGNGNDDRHHKYVEPSLVRHGDSDFVRSPK